jgi:hypothetical protein
VALALAMPVPAQAQLRTDCVRENLEAADAAALGVWAPLRPGAVAQRLQAVRDAGQWSALADSLRTIYTTPPADLSALSPAQQMAIGAQLEMLRADLERGEKNPADRVSGRITDRFRLTVEMMPLAYTLFEGTPMTPVTITSTTPESARRSVCWLAYAASDVVEWYRADAVKALDEALARRVNRWDNFMNRGYSMLPHELLVNGWLPRETLEPPTWQLILVHPSVATMIVASSLGTLRDAHREDVLALEPLGAVFYNKDRGGYAGLSFLLTFPDERGLGMGGMLHVARIGHVAYVNRPRESDGRRRNGVLVSLDLYRYVAGAAQKWKDLRDQAVQECKANPVECASR